jgi:hypothetical protein
MHWISPYNREVLTKINERCGNNWFHNKDVADLIDNGMLARFYQRGFLERMRSDCTQTRCVRKWKLSYAVRSRL